MRKTVLWLALPLAFGGCSNESPAGPMGQAGDDCAALGIGCAPEEPAPSTVVPEVSGQGAGGSTSSMPTGEQVMPGELVGQGANGAAGGGNASGGAGAAPVSDEVDMGVPGYDRCDVGVFDPNDPPEALVLTGSLGAHDPVIMAANGQYHYFATGGGISSKSSANLLTWANQGPVFATLPAWLQQLVPDFSGRSLWAPDISYFGGQYHLYYSVSSFGSNRSCIGHATRAALDAGEWTDRESVFCSNQPGQTDNFNAIDPNVIVDAAGTPWMAFGSFWSGIEMIRLNQEGNRDGTELLEIASRGGGAIEAPFIVRRCGYYYLFVSFDRCCQGADSTYNTRVGRSSELAGPYVDKAGTPMLSGGGSLVLQAGGDWAGPGHNAILIEGTRAYNVYHAYAVTNGASQLRISELVWDSEGWPISGGP